MRGWVPADEGAYAQSADRVLHGELPHRDYLEIYTGGLAYLHAFAFRFLGENFATMRIVLFLFFMAWVPVFFWIASRMVADWVAGAVTLLAVVWSLPNYSAAVPSWYNLFFATFGMAAVFQYLGHRSSKWLFVAGICGGCSILAKIPGLYFVAAIVLFFAFSTQCEPSPPGSRQKSRSVAYSVSLVLSVLLFAGVLARLTLANGGVEELIAFALPTGSLCGVILLRERHYREGSDADRFARLLRMCVPFVLGTLIPLGVFLLPYIKGHAVGALLHGVFVLTFRRLSYAESPPVIATIVPSLCLLGILLLGVWLHAVARWILCSVAAGLFLYYFLTSIDNPRNYQIAWHCAYWLIPVVVLVGASLLYLNPPQENNPADSPKNNQLFLVLAVAAMCSLVQYPFSIAIYFCYVSPLGILGALAVLRRFPSMSKSLLAIVGVGFLLFPVFRFTPSFIYRIGSAYQPDPETQPLDLPGAGNLRVERATVPAYHHLIALIKEHAGNGEIYAAPDSPQIYLLAGYKNPTRSLFDFFDEKYPDLQGTLDLMDAHSIRVIVLNQLPDFSPALPADLHEALAKRFPKMEKVGPFEVRWRE
jgi:hypothetical protein